MVTVAAGETQSNHNMAYNKALEFNRLYEAIIILEHFGSLSQIKFEIAIIKIRNCYYENSKLLV